MRALLLRRFIFDTIGNNDLLPHEAGLDFDIIDIIASPLSLSPHVIPRCSSHLRADQRARQNTYFELPSRSRLRDTFNFITREPD